MIANYTAGGWEIITQRAHGLLAAQLAAQWQASIRHERWTELLLAIAEHDDAQVELERDNLLTPQGGPVDFKMKTFELRHATQTMDFALSKSRYIAWLCSRHLEFVYGDAAAANAGSRKFLKAQVVLRKQWLKELGLKKAEAERDYRLLEWCDALSLLLCQHENQPEARRVEISNGPDQKVYLLVQTAPGELTVKPWPFGSPGFKVAFETRLIPQLVFEDAAAFRDAFRKALVIEKTWQFKRQV